MRIARDSSHGFILEKSTMARIAFILSCLAVALTLTGCGETTQRSSPTPTAGAETLSTTEPAPDPSPTAGPAPTPAPTPSAVAVAAPDDGWRGLTVAAEDPCSPYDPDDYTYSQSVEPRVIAGMGGIVYGPYTGRMFADRGETDIERIVARSEAHDSGLCDAGSATRKRFSSDLMNLTLAAPNVNRHQKVAKDAAEWLPEMNRRWFADRVIRVRQKYDLTMDRREAETLHSILSACKSVEMVIVDAPRTEPT